MGLFGQGCQRLSEHREHKTKTCCPAALWGCHGFAPALVHIHALDVMWGCKSVQVICYPHVAQALVFQGQLLMALQRANPQGGPVINLNRALAQGGRAVGSVLLSPPLCPHGDAPGSGLM